MYMTDDTMTTTSLRRWWGHGVISDVDVACWYQFHVSCSCKNKTTFLLGTIPLLMIDGGLSPRIYFLFLSEKNVRFELWHMGASRY
eukprot:gene9922-biopygen2905